MNTANFEKKHFTEIRLLFIACLGFILIIGMDRMYWGRDVLSEGLPNFSTGYLMRSSVIFMSTLCLFLGLFGKNIVNNIKSNFDLDVSHGLSLERLSILATPIFSLIFLLLFIADARSFNALSSEDNALEWVSFLLLFICAIIFFLALLKKQYLINIPKFTKLSMLVIALGFFFISMEEISWFQRVFAIATPEMFVANIQHEMNFHNFATDVIENLYYFGAFLLLVALPFIRFLFPSITNNNYFKLFIPRPFIAIVGSIACAYNFDMWNIIFTQIAYIGSLLILLTFLKFSAHEFERYTIVFTIFIIIATQITFLLNGERFARLWEVTEYKEFFIALAYLIYAIDINVSIRRVYYAKIIQ